MISEAVKMIIVQFVIIAMLLVVLIIVIKNLKSYEFERKFADFSEKIACNFGFFVIKYSGV